MAEETLKRKAFKGVLWKIGEQFGRQIIALTIGVVLARLVAPDQFGAIAMLTVFVAVAEMFIDSGFTQALMRKEDRTQLDCCTVFYFNIFVSIVAYAVLYLIAPWVADFYDMPVLKPLLRVLGFTIVLGSLSGVQGTLFYSKMKFNVLVKYALIAQVIAGGVGIWMAYHGMEVWALVGQQYTSCILNSIFLWMKSDWRPQWMFSFKTLREFFGFGSKLLASGLLETVYSNMYDLFIGKFYNASQLAFFNKAKNQRALVTSTPTSILQSVTFPTLSKLQHDNCALRNGYRRTIRVSAFVIFPLALGMGAVAYPMINVMYTQVWIEAATLLNIIVFAGMLYPLHAINLNLLIVKGRSDYFLKLEIAKKVIGVIAMLITIPISVRAICYGMVVSSVLCLVINTWYTPRLIQYSIWDQCRDLAHILALSLVMWGVVKYLCWLLGMGWISLGVGIAAGLLIYGAGAVIFRFPELRELIDLFKGK